MPIAASPFILPRGVTGFGDRQSVPEPHYLLKELQALVHEVARRVHGQITGGETSDLVGSNFHRLHLEGRGVRATLLLNAFHPLVGFTEAHDTEPLYTEIPTGFLAPDHGTFIFIGKAILTSPPDERSLSELAPAEIRQIEYWRPRRLGDIIFNRWD